MRALEQIATLPGPAALRREQIKLQVALITPLIHVKGCAAAETKAAAEQAVAEPDRASGLVVCWACSVAWRRISRRVNRPAAQACQNASKRGPPEFREKP
jgi:hypothetical protein